MVIRGSQGAVLVDAGIPQRTLLQELRHVHIEPADLRGIIITHEHGDHTTSAIGIARRVGIPIMATAGTLQALQVPADITTVRIIAQQGIELAGMRFEPIAVRHDAAEPVAVVVKHDDVAATIATDLGSWDEALAQAARHSQLIVIEANHEREKLSTSRYDHALKLRITSSHGHLDNIQAGEFLAHVCTDGQARHVWLAHLSHEANTPHLAIRSVQSVLTMHQVQHMIRAMVALPRRGTVSWGPEQRSHQQTLW